MAAPSQSRPGRTLLALGALLAIMLGAVAMSAQGDKGQWTPKLGLDLVGGTSINLTATREGGEVTPEAMDQAIAIIRNRVDPRGVTEAEVSKQTSGNQQTIQIAIPGERDEALLERVRRVAQLNFRLVLQQGASTPPGQPAPGQNPAAPPGGAGVNPPASPAPSGSGPASPSASVAPAPTASPTSAGRVLPQGLREAEAPGSPEPATPQDPAAPVPTAPEPVGAPGSVQDLLAKAPADISQRFAELDCLDPAVRDAPPDDPNAYLVACSQDPNDSYKYLLAPAALVGDNIETASAGLATNAQGQTTGGGWQVQLNFDGDGTRKWRDFTTLHAPTQDQVAVVLDGEVVSAPSINEPIPGGETSITGSFSQTEARDLSDVLKFGALPLTFTPGTVQEISPTLGSKQLRGGLLAGVLGLLLVILYSLLYYRGLGLVNVFSLAVSAVMTYLTIVLLSNTNGLRLSLAGVAGLVIGIGIAADSFIVYFERLRDEMRDGKTMRVAAEVGWRRARRTILAADFVSFLAAGVLYVLSVGAVRGFAVTLGITTIIDVIVVFLFTKPAVTLLARTKFFSEGHPLSGLAKTRIGAKTPPPPARGKTRKPGLAAGTATRTAEQEA